MNIFILDKNPILAARDHCDKHVVKMILESGQMLAAAHWLGWARMLDAPKLKPRELQGWLYDNVPRHLQPAWKMTHVNHPCTQWAARCWGNYMWLSQHGLELCREYTERYGREHKSHDVHRWLTRVVPPTFETTTTIATDTTPFAIAMPEDCKVAGDAVQSYRNYYTRNKAYMAKWAHGDKPNWWQENNQ